MLCERGSGTYAENELMKVVVADPNGNKTATSRSRRVFRTCLARKHFECAVKCRQVFDLYCYKYLYYSSQRLVNMTLRIGNANKQEHVVRAGRSYMNTLLKIIWEIAELPSPMQMGITASRKKKFYKKAIIIPLA